MIMVDIKAISAYEKAFGFFDGIRPCREGPQWSVPDRAGSDVASEIEVLSVLFSMVYLLKPEVVIETGCDVGCASRVIGAALALNGSGHLYTCDLSGIFIASNFCVGLPVTVCQMTGGELIKRFGLRTDMAFLDSSFDSRMQEYDMLPQGCLVLIHDVCLSTDLATLVKSKGGIILKSARGLGIIRK